ncbi:hypothetical protein AVEN_62507-1 [Araneus ventricosus]|uniref:Uncharacterized protein n=1 Tax=Araneus ventricosus TaxID=182803 RepID=A0A4Y2KKZ7_ARAVE|nr:hypothetical protein AVEN_62507-1 [Araneus ventricosus]
MSLALGLCFCVSNYLKEHIKNHFFSYYSFLFLTEFFNEQLLTIQKCKISGLKFDVLSCQAYKLTKARYTLSNEAISEFHRKTVARSMSEKLMDLYSSDMEKKLKKQDSKELKQNPPRVPSFITV